MCQYHYVYFDKCQHVSFYKVSYCNKAKEFGLPRLHGHSPSANSTGDTPGDDFSPASSHPPTSSADNSSSSHPHNQHNSHNMSTLTRSGAGATFACNNTPTERGNHMPQHVALIPRSALQEGRDLNLEANAALSSSLLDTPRGDLNLPSDHESSLSLATGRNGRATALILQSEATSDESQGSQFDHTRASSMSTVYSYASDADTVRGPPSSRKPIPSQWGPVENAPTLATAQRAKERGYKPGSVSGSPTKASSLRGTRSMADFGRPHAAEASSFLTKTSHVPLESNLTSPTARKSPTKHARASSKPAWNSPSSSPLRDSPRQQPHLIIRTSPVKTELLTAKPTSYGHQRGASCVTTSTTGESIYHSAESSPVRDTADLTLGVKSTAEVFDEDDHNPAAQLHTDIEDAQKSRFVHTSVKAATVGRASKPSLRIDIPRVDARTNAGERSSTSYASATSNSAASNSPHSPVSAASISRIPRASATGNLSSARGPTRSSTLKRAQSTKSLTSPKSKVHVQSHDSQRQPKTPTVFPRHVRTVDCSGTTPILSEGPAPPCMIPVNLTSNAAQTESSPAQEGHTTIEQVESMLRKSTLDEQHDLLRTSRHQHAQSSRASSISTVKASTAVSDHSAIDPAIVYSKKSTAFGTNLGHPLHVPDIIVMMAHNLELGPQKNEDKLRTRSASSTSRLGSAQNVASGRGRTEQYVPVKRRQAVSEHSLDSSLASELRATAMEFVPYPANSSSAPDKAGPEQVDISQLDPTTDLLGPVKYELDPYGIPWFYYMYQVQFAFDQGYQKGRSRSPKKTRQKKQYPPGASTTDFRKHNVPAMAPAYDTYQEQQRISTMPPPASTVPLAEQRAQQQQLNADIETSQNDELAPSSPFAAQKALIDRHFPYRNATVTDRPVPGIDLTTIRNVGLPHGPRSMIQKTMPVRGNHYPNARRNHHRSDNGLYTYRGRGAAGLRMADTVPFPAPVAPQGRPAHSNAPGEGCGSVGIIYGAERIGGEACQDCERDHPLD